MRAAIDTGWSGEVRTQGSLSVPLTGSTFGGVARLLGESSQLRVWWRDDEDWRVDRISPTGETDLVREGGLVDPAGTTRTTPRVWSTWSAIRLPDDNDIVPAALARAAARRGEGRRAVADPATPRGRPQRRRAAPGARRIPSRRSGGSTCGPTSRPNVPLQHRRVRRRRRSAPDPDAARSRRFDDESPLDGALQLPVLAPDVDFHEGFSFDSVAAANAFAPFLLPMRAIGLERHGDPAVLGAVGVYGRGPTALLVIPLRDSTAQASAQTAGEEPERPDGRAERGPRGRPPVGAAGGGSPGVPQPQLHDGGNFLLAGTVTPAALRQAAVELQNGVLRTQ